MDLRDVNGMVGTNVIDSQLQTGEMEIPSILGAMKDSGVIGVSIEDGEKDSNGPIATEVLEDTCNDVQYSNNKFHQGTQTQLSTVFKMTDVRLGP